MKTLDEVIKAFEICIGYYCSNAEHDVCPYFGESDMGCMKEPEKDALHYLKEYRDSKATIADVMKRYTQAALLHMDEADKLATQRLVMEYDNPPLTWDELKQMEGKPVWIEWIGGYWKGSKKWVLSHGCDDLMMVFTALDVAKARYGGHLRQIDLGKTWQAYRKER